MGVAFFANRPNCRESRAFLGRTVSRTAKPEYIICDRNSIVACRGVRRWVKGKGVKPPTYGAVGKQGSIAVIERFIKSLKDEWLRRLIVPLHMEAMRKDLSAYLSWFNEHRPHQALDGRTPLEVYEGRASATQVRRFEPRAKWPVGHDDTVRRVRLALSVSYYEGRRHLPIIELRRAA